MTRTYRVRVRATVDLIYEVEADSKKDAIAEADAMAGAGDLPVEIEAIGFGKTTIEKVEVS